MQQNENKNGTTVIENNNFRIKLFNSVVEGSKLVCVNKFTGKITVKDPGLRFNWPWIANKKISSESQPLSTPPTKTIAKDKITISYDTDYHYKIVDPILYTRKEQSLSAAAEYTTIEKMIGNELDQLMANYVKSKESKTFSGNSNLDVRDEIQEYLNDIEKRYGIEITKLLLTNVKLPQEITNQAEQAYADEIRRPNELANARNEKEKAELAAEANAARAKGAAKAYVDAGFSTQDATKILTAEKLANGSNTTIVATGQNGDNIVPLATTVSMIKQLMENTNPNTRLSSSAPSQPNLNWDEKAVADGHAKGTPEFWQYAPNDEYLSAEDSKTVWAEMEKGTLPLGARVHKSYLSSDLMEKYFPTESKGKSR